MSNTVSTQTMARILGPFVAIIGCAVALRAKALTVIVPGFLDDAPLVLITGAFTLALGLIMIAAHQRWNSAPAIIISVIGWVTAVRGALLLLAGEFVGTIASYVVVAAGAITAVGVVATVLGLWLVFMGWFTKST